MFKLIIFLILLISILVSFIVFVFQRGKMLLGKKKSKILRKHSNKSLKVMIIFLLSIVFLVAFTQYMVSTPKINGEMAISELIKVKINEKEQWVSIRGKNKNKPILLFLAGGPGGSQLGAVRRNLAALEEEFVIVNWEQPGSGKSYHSIETKNLSVNNYVNDGIALTDYLRDRFNKDKIYLMGESWGSALGIFLIDEKPDYFYAFIGTGQMVAFKETEIRCYNTAMTLAKKKEDNKQIDKLQEIGKPPYYNDKMALTTATYLQYLSKEMANNPKIHNPGYNTLEDLSSVEYGILDQINFFRGMLRSFSKVYPQLYPIDLRRDYSNLEVPIYIFHGRYDLNAPVDLVEDYYSTLKAPDKKLVWFEHSGHSPWINENELFCKKAIELLVQHNQ